MRVPELPRLRRGTPHDRDGLVALQHDAYETNRPLLGGTPAPLTWDYGVVLMRDEVWLAESGGLTLGALVLEHRDDCTYVASIAVRPAARVRGVGALLLALAERRASALRRPAVRLIANARLAFNVDWYARSGYAIERVETVGERRRIHMVKPIGSFPATTSPTTSALGGAET